MDSFVVGSSIKYCLGNKRSLTGARNSQVFDWLYLVCSESVPVMGGQKGWVYGTIREAVGFQILIIGAREPDSEARIGAREQDSEAQVRYINAL